MLAALSPTTLRPTMKTIAIMLALALPPQTAGGLTCIHTVKTVDGKPVPVTICCDEYGSCFTM